MPLAQAAISFHPIMAKHGLSPLEVCESSLICIVLRPGSDTRQDHREERNTENERKEMNIRLSTLEKLLARETSCNSGRASGLFTGNSVGNKIEKETGHKYEN